ncbi:MAG: hypothetical protein E7C49_00095 [Clostridium sp.]|nr:hypothetical protein [Clostridium sp.]
MQSIYKSYECSRCRKTTILLSEEVTGTINSGKYLSCAHCGCKKLLIHKSTDDLREVMKSRRYKRNNHGAIVEIT